MRERAPEFLKGSERDFLKKAYETGFEYEKKAHFCAQCVVAALEDLFDIKDETLLRAAYPLSGGFGSTIEGTCGALSGGAMIIGYFFGRGKEEFKEGISNRKAPYLTKLLYEKFSEKYGSCICKNVQKKIFGRSFNFWDEKDREEFEEAGRHEKKCPSVVADVCFWTAKIIYDEICSNK